jgi:succinate-acetate transporter protein
MFLNAMYGGLGQSLGAIIGGKLQSKFGTVKTFVYSGIFDLCFVGFLLLYLGLRKDSSFRNATPIGMDLDENRKKKER